LTKSVPSRGGVGFGGLFAMLFGTIIGVGWVVASRSWILAAGPGGATIAFGAGALVMILIALCYAELMTVFPESSGTIGYVYESFGLGSAFVVGWLLLGSYVATCAFFVVSVPWLLKAGAPQLLGPTLYTVQGAPVELGSLAVSAAIALVLGLANHWGARTASQSQSVIVCAKVVLALALVVAAFYGGEARRWSPPFVGDSPREQLGTMAFVFITTPFWFGGFDYLPQMFRERDPSFPLRRVGSLMISGVVASQAFYAMVILATAALVDRDQLAGLALPVYDAFRSALDSRAMGHVVLAVAFLGILSAWNATIFGTSRLTFALSAARLIPRGLDGIHSGHGTPVASIWAVTGAGVVLGLLGPAAVNIMATAASVTLCAAFVFVCAALARDRKRRPDRARAYRVPGGMSLVYLGLVTSCGLLLLALADPFRTAGGWPVEWILVVVWVLAGAVWWFWGSAQRARIAEEERRTILLGVD